MDTREKAVGSIGMILMLAHPIALPAQAPTAIPVQKETSVPAHATGTFEVKLTPQATDSMDGATLGRMSIDKKFLGDLEGTSKGEMLTVLTSVEGSAGYVAIERVSGLLHGRRGTFTLQHNGSMSRGAQQLTITVVPDSGTDQLAGIAGTMVIRIEAGKHYYEFDYTLPPSH